jgi:hypothetical protein
MCGAVPTLMQLLQCFLHPRNANHTLDSSTDRRHLNLQLLTNQKASGVVFQNNLNKQTVKVGVEESIVNVPRLTTLMKWFKSNLTFCVVCVLNPWREKRLEMALIQISVPARENYRVIKGF